MDNYLSIESSVKSLCRNKNYIAKINAFTRTGCFFKFAERKILLKTFIISQIFL